MYDAFHHGLERTNPEVEINKDGYDPILRQPEPDYDTVLKSKLQKGYDKGFIPLDKDRENTIANYFENQQPLRTGTFKEGIKKLTPKVTPGTHQETQTQLGETGMAVGDANTFLGNDDTDDFERNLLELRRDMANVIAYHNEPPMNQEQVRLLQDELRDPEKFREIRGYVNDEMARMSFW